MLNSISVPAPVAVHTSSFPPMRLARSHSRHTVVAGASFRYDSRIDALSIIPDAQPKQTSAVGNVSFYIARLCVAESISYRLTSNSVNVVPQDRMQLPWRAFHHHIEPCRTMRRIPGGRFVAHFGAQRCPRLRQLVGDRGRGA